ncbi:MAG: AMP-binding protein, partial [Terriglobia bacterium]
MLLPLTPVRFKAHAARLYGRKRAIVCGARRFTYAEFNERCDRLSQALLDLNVQPGDRVAFLSFNCHRLLEAYYAAPQISAILLPLNIRLSPEELAWILEDASPRLLFFDPEFTPIVERLRCAAPSLRHVISLDEPNPAWAYERGYEGLLARAAPLAGDYTGIDENAVAELFYTSGTTAHPKGVMLTHRNLYLHAFYVSHAMNLRDDDVGLYVVPLFHVNSWGTPHTFTLSGGAHAILRKFDPARALELIEQERVTRLQMVPAMAVALINHPEFARRDLSSVREIMLGGAPSSVALIREMDSKFPGASVCGGYGLTETSPVVMIAALKDYLRCEKKETQLRRRASAGAVIAGAEARVVDAAGNDVRPDGREVGEVVIRSDTVMEGYWNQPEETATALREGWLHTGDLGTIDDEGYILIVDRVKDMVLSGGENVATAEIERVIYGHPAVLE